MTEAMVKMYVINKVEELAKTAIERDSKTNKYKLRIRFKRR